MSLANKQTFDYYSVIDNEVIEVTKEKHSYCVEEEISSLDRPSVTVTSHTGEIITLFNISGHQAVILFHNLQCERMVSS